MAKKRPLKESEKPKPTGRGSRKRIVAVAEIQRAAQTLGQQQANMAALVDIMQQEGIAEIEIDGYGLLERGIDEIDRFLDNVDKGVNQAKRDKLRSTLS